VSMESGRRSRWVMMWVMALALLLGWGASAWSAQGLKIGVVDVQQVLNQSQRGSALKQKLDQELAGRQKELDVRQQEIVKLQAEFEKQAPVLSEQAKREKGESLQRRVRDIRRMAEDANRDFEKRLRETEMETTREIFVVIQEYGKDQGYSMIFERNSIVYGSTAVDLTAEIVKRFDAKGK
jgi:outer membrane protein